MYLKGAADIDDEERRVRESDGREVDTLLKNNIEGIILKWAYQVFEIMNHSGNFRT